MDSKFKHLDFVQSVIIRMNSNSFMIKGWAITLLTAFLALVAGSGKTQLMPITYMVILLFWVLDGFYISQERKFRKLYESVTNTENEKINFSMDTSKFNEWSNSWLAGIISTTLTLFYGMAIVLIFITKKHI
ncbi:hypothetical protein [Aeromonas veronii]|uniref:hypothetical protein n=1 Tax=Aeromonas TaxID=642 RepID=UPI001F47FDB0|nr:hypothetical protein [Aeromonas veronii]MCF5894760.1 hypothetical protein [Aeromonas veronii]